jgi:hypothetical protein
MNMGTQLRKHGIPRRKNPREYAGYEDDSDYAELLQGEMLRSENNRDGVPAYHPQSR